MKLEYPLVSIGLPVFNSERTIDRALCSLLAQSYPNMEIIVSDNASSDKTAQICMGYAEGDSRIRLSVNPKNLGINANFKTVFDKAVGSYFMWAAGDDYWEPDFVKTLVDELEANPIAGVALCAVNRIYSDGRIRDTVQFNGKYNPNDLSNFQLAAKLLSPNNKIKDQKYNLFICGLFRYEVLKASLSLADEVISFGERALLTPVALGYRFRFVDKVLFVKTVYEESFKERSPDDDYVKGKKKLKYWKYYSKIMVWILKSHTIPWLRKTFVFLILYYLTHKLSYKLKKKFRKKKFI